MSTAAPAFHCNALISRATEVYLDTSEHSTYTVRSENINAKGKKNSFFFFPLLIVFNGNETLLYIPRRASSSACDSVGSLKILQLFQTMSMATHREMLMFHLGAAVVCLSSASINL